MYLKIKRKKNSEEERLAQKILKMLSIMHFFSATYDNLEHINFAQWQIRKETDHESSRMYRRKLVYSRCHCTKTFELSKSFVYVIKLDLSFNIYETYSIMKIKRFLSSVWFEWGWWIKSATWMSIFLHFVNRLNHLFYELHQKYFNESVKAKCSRSLSH